MAAYCRVSSPSDEQELSLETQVQYYTNTIENSVFRKSVGIYADTATGRNIKQRAVFKKLLAKCRIGKVDLILTKSISRFGRNSLDTIKALRDLKDNRVDVYFEQENIHLLDSAAQHVIEIYCALAQNESENKSHSIKWGIQAGFQGGTSGYQNFTCYGYRFDEKEQGLVIVPKEAEVVRLIFDLRLRGLSYGIIAGELESRRKTPDKGRGTTTSITMRRLCRWRFLRGCKKIFEEYNNMPFNQSHMVTLILLKQGEEQKTCT